MKQAFRVCWGSICLALCWPFGVCGQAPLEQPADFSGQRRAAQGKYEKSVRLCHQKFAVSDCKQNALSVLNAELNLLKKSEEEKWQSARAQSAQEKIQSLTMKSPALPKIDVNAGSEKPLVEMKSPIPAKKTVASENALGPKLQSVPGEQAQRKRFEEKQMRAQQHRDAHEKRWADKKGVMAAENVSTP